MYKRHDNDLVRPPHTHDTVVVGNLEIRSPEMRSGCPDEKCVTYTTHHHRFN